jgi:ankyrin repeat protein
MLAAAAGHTPVIMELIRAGANVNSAKNFAGANVNTALEEAVLNAHEACVLALIHAGADVHMDGFGESIMQENTATYAEDAGAYRNIVGLLRYAASRNFLVLELDSA